MLSPASSAPAVPRCDRFYDFLSVRVSPVQLGPRNVCPRQQVEKSRSRRVTSQVAAAVAASAAAAAVSASAATVAASAAAANAATFALPVRSKNWILGLLLIITNKRASHSFFAQ